MADKGQQVPVVIYPRFTTLFGTLALASYPIDVSPYEAITLNWWTTALGGTGGPTCSMTFFESIDRISWEPFSGVSPLVPVAGTEVSQYLKFTSRWFRATITMVGTNPVMTTWLEGMLMKRQH
ncbi:MAG: hypothetical protein AB7T63_00310 [Planctomycetota bacterium]